MSITLPNILTVLRILLTPLFAIFMIRHMFDYALLAFLVAGISDGLDGLLARVFHQKSTLGAYLDPIADKLLLSTAFITLAIQRLIPSWITVVVITRDILILFGIALLFMNDRKFEIKPSLLSKVTTVFQLSTVFLVLVTLHLREIDPFMIYMYWITAGITILSGLQYMYKGLNILDEGYR